MAVLIILLIAIGVALLFIGFLWGATWMLHDEKKYLEKIRIDAEEDYRSWCVKYFEDMEAEYEKKTETIC